MKKVILIGLSLVLLAGAGVILATGQIPFLVREGVETVASAQESGPVASETAVAVDVEGPAVASVVAEGVVVPVQQATLSMAASGIVAQVLAKEGDRVIAGQVLLRLQDAHQQAALAEAAAALDSARAGYEALKAGARTEEVAAARASLEAAQARLARLEEGARSAEIAAAETALQAARSALERLYAGPDEPTRIAAEAELANAEAALQQAQAAYDPVADRGDAAMLPQSLQLQQATNAYQAAQARYDALYDEPEAHVVAAAEAEVREAQATLDRLQHVATASEIAEAQAMVRQAQAQLDLILAGARQEELDAAAAAVDQAQAAVQQAQASLADTELRAPFAGTLASFQTKVGEQAVAGTPLAELADLALWQIETDDLTELDVVSVEDGERVILTFDAIPGLEMAGRVVRIKPLAEEKLGDVTYTVVIEPESQDPRLRWGMTAVVTVP